VPYFGAKSAVAADVWEFLGNVPHYIEPFFGSGAVLLARENFDQSKNTETVNDKDGFVSNVWRSLQFSPDETARWCDWPVNHADLTARKAELIRNEARLLENLAADTKWHDPVLAGYWIWAASCWIGAGLTRPGQIPHISSVGMGVHTRGPRPDIGKAGMGVQEPYNTNIYAWFRRISERLRYVRVVCGDWTRVCGGDWQNLLGTVGIFFDPPYAVADRVQNIYHHDSQTVGKDVESWCLERGRRPDYRIVVAGYECEYPSLVSDGWHQKAWKAMGGYANLSRGADPEERGKKNRERETLFISPHCLKTELF
jgi:DNA adenine methylase